MDKVSDNLLLFSRNLQANGAQFFWDTLYMVLAIERYANRNVSAKAGFVNYFSKLFVDFRKVDLSPKLLEKFSVFFRYILS